MPSWGIPSTSTLFEAGRRLDRISCRLPWDASLRAMKHESIVQRGCGSWGTALTTWITGRKAFSSASTLDVLQAVVTAEGDLGRAAGGGSRQAPRQTPTRAITKSRRERNHRRNGSQ